jgi:hypothetical protein
MEAEVARKPKEQTVDATEIGGEVPTNGAEESIIFTMPYIARVGIEGSADFLFHRWNPEAVEEKSRAAKGSKAKKTDNIESYVYRDDTGMLAIPGEYIRGAIIGASKFKQDPRSPRKSAQDLVKAAVISLTLYASVGKKRWDYEDKRRAVVHRNGINRTRPALKAGWRCEFELQVNLPEYVNPATLNDLITMSGKLIGIGDFRPTYGRFHLVRFEVSEAA